MAYYSPSDPFLSRLGQSRDFSREEQERAEAKEQVDKLFTKALGSEATSEHREQLSEAVVSRGEGKRTEGARARMPNPPGKITRFGGWFETERDEQHCPCGRPIAEHGTPRENGNACSMDYRRK